MKVLLVDDEPMMRKMLKLALQKRGFEVFDAGKSADALAVAEKHSIDVLVTDVVMEEMDGWTLASLLTERRPNLPIVFTSGYPIDFESKRQDYACCAFLPKPFLAEDLIRAISSLRPG